MPQLSMHTMKPTSVIALAGALLLASLTSVLTAQAPAASQAASAPAQAAPVAAQSADAQLATMQQYCVACHNDRAKVAGVSFQGLTPESVAQHAEVLEKAVRKMRGRVMPPPNAKQAPSAAIDSLVAYLEGSLDGAPTPAHISDKLVLHRLNRKEYANAIRDLLAVDFDASEVLPADDIAEGFDNIASALQVSPSFIEQYVIAARAVAVKAIGKPDARPGGWTFRAGAGTQLTHVPGLPLGTRGGILAKVDLPSDGEYQVDIADMATHIWGNGMEFENPLIVTLDNKLVYETVIGGEEDMKAYDQVQNGALDRVNARLKKIRFHATAGPHKIGVAFKRRTFAESDDQLQMFAPGGGQDRLYRVQSFQLQGPFDANGIGSTPSRDRIFTCKPESAAGQETPASAKASARSRRSSPESDASEVGCAKQIVTALAMRAYRRPVTAEDVNELMQYYQEGAKDPSTGSGQAAFESGIRSALTGLLASPFFLYRGERVPAGLRSGESYAISDLELASKLSFFLWNTIPDDELLQLGVAGKLSDPATLDKQVRRMLGDPRSVTLASNFFQQWLDMKRLDEIVPDSAVFPYASGRSDPREDFRTELTLFADSIFREDRSVIDLLRAKHTFLNERVALHYGITDVKGDRFRRVELANSTRWGLLGKGAVLMAAAYPNRTSPVLRGAFILKHIQGVPPATPPPNVPTLDEKDIGTTKARTVREMMATHRSNPTCAACHAVMDPLGLALENFDATGMWRDRDRYAGTTIDSSGVLPDGTPIKGPDDLREALLKRPDQFAQTFTEGLLTYATGRKLEYYDMPTVRRIVHGAAASDYRFSTIVQAVVRSDQFRMRRVPAPVAGKEDTSAAQ
jgi:mono/diheme cytochrome c family protein